MAAAASTRSLLFVLFVLGQSTRTGFGFSLNVPLEDQMDFSGDGPIEKDEGPLILTPYLDSGEISVARNLSKVESFIKEPEIKSYSGFFTVNKKYDSNMFFWFFPSLHNYENAPVILWLNGGPGHSGIDSLFRSIGPYALEQGDNVTFREHTWIRNFSLLFVDNPVQTGFSFTGHQEGLARNQRDVAKDLRDLLRQFFVMFPELERSTFYVGGVSYGGKYAPAIAYHIHCEKEHSGIHLRGIIIESGYCDPEHMINYADFLYQTGMIDRRTANYFKGQQNQVVSLIRKAEFWKAFRVFNRLILDKDSSYFKRVTGLKTYHNYLFDHQDGSNSHQAFIQSPKIRKAIHVGNAEYNDGNEVLSALMSDIMQSVKPWLETLLDHYKVLMYNGQADVIVSYAVSQGFLEAAYWKDSESFKKAERIIWKVRANDSEVAGYVRQVGTFTEAMVRNAGHAVSHDKPREVLDLIRRFIYGRRF